MKNLNRIVILILTALTLLFFIGCSKKIKNVSKAISESKSNTVTQSQTKLSVNEENKLNSIDSNSFESFISENQYDSSFSFETRIIKYGIFKDSVGNLISLPTSEEHRKTTKTNSNKNKSEANSKNSIKHQNITNIKNVDSLANSKLSIKEETSSADAVTSIEKKNTSNTWIAYTILIVFGIIGAIFFYLYIKP